MAGEAPVKDGVRLLFGRYLIVKNLVSQEDLEMALTVQAELDDCHPCLVLEFGRFEMEQFRRCKTHQRQHGQTFREALLALKLMDPGGLAKLEALFPPPVRVGELLVLRGAMTRAQLERALQDYGLEGEL